MDFYNAEKRLWEFYQSVGVKTPSDITLYHFDHLIDCQVYHRVGRTSFVRIDSTYHIFLDESQPLYERRVELAHEFGHIFLHTGYQNSVSIIAQRQEHEADLAALHMLIPTPLLWQAMIYDEWPYTIAELSQTFGVPEWFMAKRLNLFRHHITKKYPYYYDMLCEKYNWGS